jgi:RNA polymerase sigma-70 factor (ECF subfamily)
LEEALSRLSETQRSLVLLKDYEGYSYEEIGRITALSESQVKVTCTGQEFNERVPGKN